jgi:hypothetical protein
MASTISPQNLDRNARACAVLAALLAGVHTGRFFQMEYALDDAWISFRAARNLVGHGVLSFNLSAAPVEGMTNLLWTLMSAVWIALAPEVDPIYFARALGTALHMATAATVAILAAELAPKNPTQAAALAGGLFAAQGSMAFYAMSGLETALWAFLFVYALRALFHGRWVRLGCVVSALAATRPEGVMVGAVLGLLAWRRAPRQGVPTLLIFAAALAVLEGFRWTYYGALVPNTFHAKSPDLMAGVAYLGSYCAWGLGLGGPLVLAGAWRLRETRGMALLVPVLIAGTVLSGGDWMPGWRRFGLCTILFILLGAAGAATAGRWRVLRLVGLACLAMGTIASGFKGLDNGRYPHEQMARLGAQARATPGVETVALVDIGRFGWTFPGRIVDLVGLTDASVAHRVGTHGEKTWDEEWFREQGADLLIVRSATEIVDPLPGPLQIGSPERPMVRSVLEHGGYRMVRVQTHAAGQWMLVFARDGLELPTHIWGAPAAQSLRALLGG